MSTTEPNPTPDTDPGGPVEDDEQTTDVDGEDTDADTETEVIWPGPSADPAG
jgi:hypothetical protein